MIVHLSQPLAFDGGTIDQVTVRVPAETDWDANPEGADEAAWNLSKATGLPLELLPHLAPIDVDAIAAAFLDASSRWNVAAAGEFTSHRAYRRAHLRRSSGRRYMTIGYDLSPHAHFMLHGTLTEDYLMDMFDIQKKGTCLGGRGIYERAACLGKITASGKWIRSLTTATDGSQIIRGILLHDVDTSYGDVDVMMGVRGPCNGAALRLEDTGHTLASLKNGVGISSLIDLQSIIG